MATKSRRWEVKLTFWVESERDPDDMLEEMRDRLRLISLRPRAWHFEDMDARAERKARSR